MAGVNQPSRESGKSQKKNRLMVHVYVTYDEKKRIEVEANKLGISVSAYLKVKLFS